jgi:hypothetical protein
LKGKSRFPFFSACSHLSSSVKLIILKLGTVAARYFFSVEKKEEIERDPNNDVPRFTSVT